MKQVLIGAILFAAGAALATWYAESRSADVTSTTLHSAEVVVTTPRSLTAVVAPTPSSASTANSASAHFALQAWEGCRSLQAGDAFSGPITRTLTLSDGSSVEVSLVPAKRDNGAQVFDTFVKSGGGSSRTQIAFNSPLEVDGVLMRPVDLREVMREVSGDAAYLHGPHPAE